MIVTGEDSGARRETFFSVTLFITNLSQLASDRTRVSAARGRLLTFGAIARLFKD
jgi:hypothetical protein